MSDSDSNEDETRILKLMNKYNCSRKNALERIRSASIAVALLNPNLYKPMLQPQPQPIEESEPETETEEPQIDPLLEEKQSQLEQKQRILDKLENQLDREQLEDEAFQAILEVPQWRELLLDYVKSVRMLLDGWADYYVYSAQKIGDKINHGYEFYKNNKKVTVDTVFKTSSGDKTVSEILAEQEKKKQELLDQIKHKDVATVEKAEEE